MTAGARLAMGGIIVLSATIYLACVGASSSWQYYLTVDECLSPTVGLAHRPIRVSGEVRLGSLIILAKRQGAEFELVGNRGNLHVCYAGHVPDNLAEARQVVVEGQLQESKVLQADYVLTRCSSKYAAPDGREDSLASAAGTAE